MGSLEWRDVERVLDQALDLEPKDWPSFLDERCSDQPELRLEVESLLRASRTPDSLLDQTPRLVGRDILDEVDVEVDSDGFEPGRRVDRYEVVRLLGRGGQGSVYLAQRSDGVFDKQVALKVVKRGMVTKEVLTRFRDERQILADLEHANIAGILDGGVTEDGLPFLVMELVEGEPIDEYCDRKLLGVEERLRLFITVCAAVHYAHRNLVLHRDLKPGNILVADDGTVKLLDFGIARVMEPHGSSYQAMTQAAIPRLTPEYAAPEQVMGTAMTTATDVYALGVVLYELLTGLRPYEIPSRSLMAVQKLILEVDPALPSRAVEEEGVKAAVGGGESVAAERGMTFTGLRDTLRGDLDAIVMKALEKEPENRYRSAADLMRDVDRYLTGRTVEARPHTRWYRAAKFVRRNTLLVGVTAAAFAVLGLGLAGTTWQWTEARRQSALRQAEADRAEAARGFMVQVFDAFDPDELQGREMTPGLLIDRGLEKLRALEGRPDLQLASLNALGRVALNLGETDRADSIFLAAIALGQTDSPETNLDLAESLAGRGEILRNRLASEASIEALEQSLAIKKRVLQPDDPNIGRGMADLAFSYYASGVDSLDLKADSLLRRAGDFQLSRSDEAYRLQVLADVRMDLGDLEEAADLYVASTNMLHEAVGSDHPEIGRSLVGLGLALRRLERYDSAAVVYESALEIFRTTYGEQHFFVGGTLHGLAQTYFLGGRYRAAAAAAAEMERAIDPEGWTPAGGILSAQLLAARSHRAIGDNGVAERLLRDVVSSTMEGSAYDQRRANGRLELAELLVDTNRRELATEVVANMTEAERATLSMNDRNRLEKLIGLASAPVAAERP